MRDSNSKFHQSAVNVQKLTPRRSDRHPSSPSANSSLLQNSNQCIAVIAIRDAVTLRDAVDKTHPDGGALTVHRNRKSERGVNASSDVRGTGSVASRPGEVAAVLRWPLLSVRVHTDRVLANYLLRRGTGASAYELTQWPDPFRTSELKLCLC